MRGAVWLGEFCTGTMGALSVTKNTGDLGADGLNEGAGGAFDGETGDAGAVDAGLGLEDC